ncbi:MAG: 23S rRNA (adenine(2503)-C(2))-methyltransferase RlmN [Proteobacteria bacterium]|nr:23S rRNA (adenine(2503)-C(2))-methyltransferase RlmN [Pseudomonadota bacterium]
MEKKDIKEISQKKLADWLQENGEKPYRAGQVFKWLYLRQTDSFDEMTDLSKNTREILKNNFSIHRLEKSNTEISSDGTIKYLFRLEDGEYTECVLIPGKNRYTLCISSQVGCAQGCRFCLTARGGFKRNLTSGEIVSQIRDILHDIPKKEGEPDTAKSFQNIVFMGMGEPLANFSNVSDALEIIMDSDYGLKFSSRKITLSTCGLVERFNDLGDRFGVNLAVSLNATDNETRTSLMPVNRIYPIEKLIDACARFPMTKREKITFEYILIKGINDSEKNALDLAKLLAPVKAKINLIPFNEFEGCEFKTPDEETILNFLSILHDKGYTAIVRKSMGKDISAACGQLRANQINKLSS